jgi:hypothetical protein
MSRDARFADGAEHPLNLVARDAEDLAVISALVQDAVLDAADMTWDRRKRRFAALVNRFRWEDRAAAEAGGRPYERVRAMLVAEDVTAVQSLGLGLDRGSRDAVLSILSLAFAAGEDGTGRLTLTLAGDGAVALSVEALEVTLKDVTRPYRAPSGKVPTHG